MSHDYSAVTSWDKHIEFRSIEEENHVRLKMMQENIESIENKISAVLFIIGSKA